MHNFTDLALPLAAILGIDTGKGAVDAAIVAGLVAVGLAIGRAIVLTLSRQIERERDLYSQAFKAALAWKEMLYRVRRREDSHTAERRLVDQFHELQEQIDYFEGWTASEGASIGRSYCRLVRDVKELTEPLIQCAWDNPPRKPSDPTPDDEDHPDVRAARERFLKDVRGQLSLLLVPRINVWWRNRDGKESGESS